MNSNRTALIMGSGIAGPVAALFLQRAGINAEIYESRSQIDSDSGYFLNLAGNGIDVLKTLGIEQPILAEGSPVPQMVMWSGNGKRLGEVRNGARDGLTESVTIRRGVLQRRLLEAAMNAGIPVHFGKRLRDIDINGADNVTARFEDGTQANGNLLLGCDGIHSRTRQIINPNAPKPSYTQLVSTGGFTSALKLPPTPKTQHFIFGKRAFFGYHVRSSSEIYWFNNHTWYDEPDRSELASISSDEWRERLLEMHKSDLPLIRDIIAATDSGISGYSIYDIPSQPIWHKGPVVLVGDAVHAVSPSSGQGTSLAMEDAAVLAKCLYADAENAFANYEALRRPRVEKIVTAARKFGAQKTISNPVQVWFRDLMMPFFLKLMANPTDMDWMYSYKVDVPALELA